jgi:hypothetical protein
MGIVLWRDGTTWPKSGHVGGTVGEERHERGQRRGTGSIRSRGDRNRHKSPVSFAPRKIHT